MEALIKMVSEKTGISEAQATTAVNTVVTFLKDKMPAGIGAQVNRLSKAVPVPWVISPVELKIKLVIYLENSFS